MTYSLMTTEPKIWASRCPVCGSRIKWSLNNSKAGSKSRAYCSKSIYASTTTFKLSDLNICNWSGTVVRQKDGGVRFKNFNGKWLREPLY
jgi:hypothetical protein